MRLNTLKPAVGSKKVKVRLGRGIGSGMGKTCGHGHKGQKARSGYSRKTGFEGGQLPLQRRIPKFGFRSRKAESSIELTLSELAKIDANKINLNALKEAGVASSKVKKVKVIASGTITKSVNLAGIKVTPEARRVIEAAGGKIEE